MYIISIQLYSGREQEIASLVSLQLEEQSTEIISYNTNKYQFTFNIVSIPLCLSLFLRTIVHNSCCNGEFKFIYYACRNKK